MSQKITIYVDGACRGNPGLGGWGAYIQHQKEQFCYCGGALDTTNNRMELTAAIQALLHTPTDAILDIWTDSNYVKQGITEWIIGWKKNGWKNSKKEDVANADLWKQLDELTQNRQIQWHWVKGHAGHFGNEMADALANRGADEVHFDASQAEQVLWVKTVDSPELVEDSPLLSTSTDEIVEHKNEVNEVSDWLLDDPFGFDDVPLDELSENNIQPIVQQNINTTAEYIPSASQETANDSETSAQKKTKTKKKSKRKALSAEQIQQHIVITQATRQLNGERQLILDTETTGFYYQNDDRIIEIGAIEMINRKLTGSSIHIYIQPEKEVGESVNVHGITDEFLLDKPIFSEVAHILYDYLKGAEIIAHNASFDMNFLDMEFEQVGFGKLSDVCAVIDTLAMAKAKHGGQRNSLDALVKRYDIPERDRTFHGALLDAEILADVYLAMTGGQVSLDIQELSTTQAGIGGQIEYTVIDNQNLPVIKPSDEDLAIHEQWYLNFYEKNKQKEITIFHALIDPELAAEVARLKAEEEARQKAEEEAKKKAEELAKLKAEQRVMQDIQEQFNMANDMADTAQTEHQPVSTDVQPTPATSSSIG